MAFEIAGWEVASVFAAFAMLPELATARNMRSSRVLRRRADLSSHSIFGALYLKVMAVCRETITRLYLPWLSFESALIDDGCQNSMTGWTIKEIMSAR